eukprot:SAG31_NODE_832_length_11660_cov_2.612091_6_plen_394_part_00
MAELNWSAHPHTVENMGVGGADHSSSTIGSRIRAPLDIRASLGWVVGGNGPITHYDDRTATATVKMFVRLVWKDPRLVGWPPDAELPAALWRPQMMMMSAGGNNGEVDNEAPVAFTAAGSATGEVSQVKTISGVADCSSSADTRDFPLDNHFVTLILGFWFDNTPTTDCLRFCLDHVQHAYLKSSYFVNDSDDSHAGIVMKRQEEWEMAGLYWAAAEHSSPSTGLRYGDFLVGFSRRRLPNYMLHKAVYPTLLCAYFGLCVCVVPSEDLVGRLSLLLSLFLTVYAIQWVSVDRMPKTPELTLVDRWVTLAVMYLVAIAQVSVMLQVAERLLQWRDDTIANCEWGMVVFFALVLLVVAMQGALQIRNHYEGDAKGASPSWHNVRSKAAHEQYVL